MKSEKATKQKMEEKELQEGRGIHIDAFLSEDEKRKLEQMSKNTGLSQSALLRKMIMEKKIEPKPNPEIRELVRSVERIGNEVHLIMHLAGKTGQVSKKKIEETEYLIKELKEEVRKWL